MALASHSPASRRTILAATLGGLAAAFATAVGRPRLAAAADGETILVGGDYNSTSVTSLTNNANGATVFSAASASSYGVVGSSGSSVGVYGSSTSLDGVRGVSTSFNGVSGISGSNVGVRGTGGSTGVYGSAPGGFGVFGVSGTGSGVRAQSTSGYGVYAQSTSGYGVYALSSTSAAVWAEGSAIDKPAIFGWADASGTGVKGFSGTDFDSPPATPAKTGVYGYAAQNADARGVWGRTTTGRGVYGQASSGQGVRGYSSTGAAGYFSTSGLKRGAAIRAIGRVRLDNCAGIAVLGATAASVVVTPGIDLTSTSAVVATLMSNVGTVMVRRVAVNTTADTFTIVLTGSAPSGTKIAWHVFG